MYIITGGGSGIGRALALSLAKRGKPVLIIGRREQLLKDTAAAGGANIDYLCADVSTEAGLNQILNHLSGFEKIDALINNAGTLGPLQTLNEINMDAWMQSLNINLNAPLFLSQKFYQQLLSGSGRILNISSGAAYFPIKGWGSYCVTKAALSMMTKCWQFENELVPCASVMPGIIDTPMLNLARTEGPDFEKRDFYQKLKLQGRLVTPETVALFLTWLLLDIDTKTFTSQEWDIYETWHHSSWLTAPHQVLHWDI